MKSIKEIKSKTAMIKNHFGVFHVAHSVDDAFYYFYCIVQNLRLFDDFISWLFNIIKMNADGSSFNNVHNTIHLIDTRVNVFSVYGRKECLMHFFIRFMGNTIRFML